MLCATSVGVSFWARWCHARQLRFSDLTEMARSIFFSCMMPIWLTTIDSTTPRAYAAFSLWPSLRSDDKSVSLAMRIRREAATEKANEQAGYTATMGRLANCSTSCCRGQNGWWTCATGLFSLLHTIR
uniref:Uncharacterized protein n=1 Tax=Salmonella sp. TaxID=599 RepID=A0A482ETF8_SALSP|nr:hypothetical protein [Salmonella sp.]QBM91400.1 hypothetical protein NNIBIDOC_00070 [Salmonella sp.]